MPKPKRRGCIVRGKTRRQQEAKNRHKREKYAETQNLQQMSEDVGSFVSAQITNSHEMLGESVSLSDESVSLSHKSVSLSDESVSLSHKSVSLSDESVCLSHKSVSLSNESVSQVHSHVIPHGVWPAASSGPVLELFNADNSEVMEFDQCTSNDQSTQIVIGPSVSNLENIGKIIPDATYSTLSLLNLQNTTNITENQMKR